MDKELQKLINEHMPKRYYGHEARKYAGVIAKLYAEQQVKKNCNAPDVITPLLTDKAIEEYIWEEIPVSLSQIDIDTHSDEYIRYLNAVYWAKWGRDNSNGL